jgi:hypothetical protein
LLAFPSLKNARAARRSPAIRFTPIRVREKRMNTYKTTKSCCGYQIKANKVVKKALQTGTYFHGPRITNQELQSSSK